MWAGYQRLFPLCTEYDVPTAVSLQVNTFWEITKRQMEEKKAELRNKDREMEDAEERHQMEIKVSNAEERH